VAAVQSSAKKLHLQKVFRFSGGGATVACARKEGRRARRTIEIHLSVSICVHFLDHLGHFVSFAAENLLNLRSGQLERNTDTKKTNETNRTH
jgi:hypothetical protein